MVGNEDDESGDNFDLKTILQDTSREDFMSTYWMRRPWFSEPSRVRLESAQRCLGSTDFGFLLSRCGSFQVLDAQAGLSPLGRPLRRASFESALDAYERRGLTVLGWLAAFPARSTIQTFDSSSRFGIGSCGLTGLVRALRSLSVDLGVPSISAGVFGAYQSAGLPAHFDASGIFTIQIRGAKRWSLGKAPAALHPINTWSPREGQVPAHWTGSQEALRLDDGHDIVLRPGAALYNPPGVLHRVRSDDADQENLALTFTVPQLTWAAILGEALRASAEEDDALRAPIFADPRTLPGSPEFVAACRGQLERLLGVLSHLRPSDIEQFLAAHLEYPRRR